MTDIHRSTCVDFSAEQMFNLVDKIEEYPTFLPWCSETTIHHRTDDEVKASICLSKGGLNKSFTTLNRLQMNKMIEIRLVDGPFHHLEGFWRFETLDSGGCKVSLDMEYEFSNKLIGMLIGPVFHQITSSLVDAFCQRAKEVYGAVNAS